MSQVFTANRLKQLFIWHKFCKYGAATIVVDNKYGLNTVLREKIWLLFREIGETNTQETSNLKASC